MKFQRLILWLIGGYSIIFKKCLVELIPKHLSWGESHLEVEQKSRSQNNW